MLNQLIRYGVVGILNNALGYFIYVLLTYFWFDPLAAISILYPVGAITAYFGHFKYSFSYQGNHLYAVIRYVIAHLIGYGVNFLMLYILWMKLGFPHQAIQLLAIGAVSGVLFLLFRYFAFPKSKNS